MAAGYNLNEGYYTDYDVTDDELWAAFACVFSSKSRNNSSYKYGFLKSILDNLYNVNDDLLLTFDQVFGKFTEIYWNLVLKYKLRQSSATKDSRATYLEQIVIDAAKRYEISEAIAYENLSEDIVADINHLVKMRCKKYVVGALFEDTNRLFYSFSKRGEWIKINPRMYDFLCKHKIIIEKMNYYEWARFLERVNEESVVIKLLNKIEESTKRNNLSVYRNILFEEFEYKNCFYCGKKLSPNKIDVDHFIPWSFIKDDKLWNLVLTCPTCNRKKSDKLPGEKFLTQLINRNQQIMCENKSLDIGNYHKQMITSVYDWAQINGYNLLWEPDVLTKEE